LASIIDCFSSPLFVETISVTSVVSERTRDYGHASKDESAFGSR
jgi:hypothetical protein